LLWGVSSFPFPGPMVVFVGIIIFVITVVINWRMKLAV
jgi:hypothetical protein